MTFPDSKFDQVSAYSDAYFEQYAKAAASVDREKLAAAVEILGRAYENKNNLYVCGNGGSASISNHLVCDHGKLISTDTDLLPRTESLASNIEVITAIANDISYDQVFVHQLKIAADPGDVLITVSSSGDSENIVQAATWARANGMEVISMTGFSGGRSAEIASVNLHVDGDNYGVIEDVHQSLMHLLWQFMRQARMDENLIKERKF